MTSPFALNSRPEPNMMLPSVSAPYRSLPGNVAKRRNFRTVSLEVNFPPDTALIFINNTTEKSGVV